MSWLDDLKVGDKVVVSYCRELQIGVVTRLTKTQVVIGNRKYRKSDGGLVGGGDWSSSCLLKWSQKLQDKTDCEFLRKIAKMSVHKGGLEKLNLEALKKVCILLGGEMVSTES